MVDGGQIFREAWIAGVGKYYPGEPKAAYVAPWEDTPEWERHSAQAVYDQVEGFILISEGNAARLDREQKGRFVAICWIGQIYKHVPEPKQSYVADWGSLPDWQQQTDCDIFETIERHVLSSRNSQS